MEEPLALQRALTLMLKSERHLALGFDAAAQASTQAQAWRAFMARNLGNPKEWESRGFDIVVVGMAFARFLKSCGESLGTGEGDVPAAEYREVLVAFSDYLLEAGQSAGWLASRVLALVAALQVDDLRQDFLERTPRWMNSQFSSGAIIEPLVSVVVKLAQDQELEPLDRTRLVVGLVEVEHHDRTDGDGEDVYWLRKALLPVARDLGVELGAGLVLALVDCINRHIVHRHPRVMTSVLRSSVDSGTEDGTLDERLDFQIELARDVLLGALSDESKDAVDLLVRLRRLGDIGQRYCLFAMPRSGLAANVVLERVGAWRLLENEDCLYESYQCVGWLSESEHEEVQVGVITLLRRICADNRAKRELVRRLLCAVSGAREMDASEMLQSLGGPVDQPMHWFRSSVVFGPGPSRFSASELHEQLLDGSLGEELAGFSEDLSEKAGRLRALTDALSEAAGKWPHDFSSRLHLVSDLTPDFKFAVVSALGEVLPDAGSSNEVTWDWVAFWYWLIEESRAANRRELDAFAARGVGAPEGRWYVMELLRVLKKITLHAHLADHVSGIGAVYRESRRLSIEYTAGHVDSVETLSAAVNSIAGAAAEAALVAALQLLQKGKRLAHNMDRYWGHVAAELDSMLQVVEAAPLIGAYLNWVLIFCPPGSREDYLRQVFVENRSAARAAGIADGLSYSRDNGALTEPLIRSGAVNAILANQQATDGARRSAAGRLGAAIVFLEDFAPTNLGFLIERGDWPALGDVAVVVWRLGVDDRSAEWTSRAERFLRWVISQEPPASEESKRVLSILGRFAMVVSGEAGDVARTLRPIAEAVHVGHDAHYFVMELHGFPDELIPVAGELLTVMLRSHPVEHDYRDGIKNLVGRLEELGHEVAAAAVREQMYEAGFNSFIPQS